MRPDTSQERGSVGQRRKILLVDDEPLLLDTLSFLLESRFEVVTCDDPERAWNLLRGGARFDVIVSDLCMPVLNGRQLYERIRQLDPVQAERFVILTGGATDDEGRAFLQRMGDRLLYKPFTADELDRFVDRISGLGPPANDCDEPATSPRRAQSGN